MANPPAANNASTNIPPNKSGRMPNKPLEICPDEIRLDGIRQKDAASVELKLKNPSKHKAAYKVVCNHPFVISIDRDTGFINPGGFVSLKINRLPFDAEKYDRQGRRTSLLVQHVSVAHNATDVQKIWACVTGSRCMKKRVPVKLVVEEDRILGEGNPESGDED